MINGGCRSIFPFLLLTAYWWGGGRASGIYQFMDKPVKRKQDEKVEMEKERDVIVKKTEMSILVLHTHVTILRQSTG